MINGIKGFESNVSYYNTNLQEKQEQSKQLIKDSSKEQTTQEKTINQTNEKKLEENTKDIITKIKEKQKTQSKEEMAKQKARFRNYFYNKSDYDILGEFVKFDRNEVDWKEKSIIQLEELLNKKYTKQEQEYILNISIFDIETIGDADLLVDNNLVTWLHNLKDKVAQGGKLSIWDRRLGWGTMQQEQELDDFFDSLPKEASIGDFGSWLLNNYFDEDITEFKRLYTEDMEKSTAAKRAQVEKENREIRQYNEKLAKERQKEILDKYKPIEGKTFNKKTYDMQNDPRLFYASKFLQRQNKEDVKLLLELMEKLEKKIGVDVRV